MKGIALIWLNTLMLLLIAVQNSNAQIIEPIYSKQVQYTIIKGSPKNYDKKQATMVKSSFSDIRYALNKHFTEKTSWLQNEIRVEQSNIKFYINGMDSLLTTVYSIRFDKPVEERILNEYRKIYFPPSIIPEEDYILWKSPKDVIIVSVFFNMASEENSEDYRSKQYKLKLIQNWLKENSVK